MSRIVFLILFGIAAVASMAAVEEVHGQVETRTAEQTLRTHGGKHKRYAVVPGMDCAGVGQRQALRSWEKRIDLLRTS